MRAIELFSLEAAERKTIINQFMGRKLNSPNDIALAADGAIYFTDPPYGLEGLNDSPLKEQPHNGVYQIRTGEEPTLIDGTLIFPNGIALSPDGQTLYVAVSDPASPRIYRYTRDDTGFSNRRPFFDAKPFLERDWPGLPDGMAVSNTGHVFATGPGGVFVLSPQGKAIGMIRLDRATANCAFGLDGSTLFITSGDRLLTIKTLVQGSGWND